MIYKRLLLVFWSLGVAGLLAACAPEVGSEDWCEEMTEKSKADWTANEAADFAKHCVFKALEE